MRELHIKKALEVCNFESKKGCEKTVGKIEEAQGGTVEHIIDNEFFVFEKLCVKNEMPCKTNNLLHLLFVEEGDIKIGGETFSKGDSILIPAGLCEYNISGSSVVLRYYVR